MMEELVLAPLGVEQVAEFRYELQRAFQVGYEKEFGPCSEPVILTEDIDRSLNAAGAAAYVARRNGALIGGAVVKIAPDRRHNELELLFVKVGVQSRGVGQMIWERIEALYPETETWETFTPYFEKRNIHFYVNRCGFHIVEFFHPGHPMPCGEGEEYCGGMTDEASQYFFRFVKWMTPDHRRVSPSCFGAAHPGQG